MYNVNSSTGPSVNRVASTSSAQKQNQVEELGGDPLQETLQSPNAASVLKNAKKRKLDKAKEKHKNQVEKQQKKEKVFAEKQSSNEDKDSQNDNDTSDNNTEEKQKIKKLTDEILVSDGESQIYKKATSLSSDPFDAYVMLKSISSTHSDPNVRSNAKKALEVLKKNSKDFITSGRNISTAIEKWKKLSKPETLRSLYNNVVLNENTYSEAINKIQSQFNDVDKQEEACDFLLEASGQDLYSKDMDSLEIKNLMSGIVKTRSLITIKKFFIEKKDFVKDAVKGLKIDSELPSIYNVYNAFINLLTHSRSDSTHIKNIVSSLITGKNPFIASAISNLMLQGARRTPSAFFESVINTKQDNANSNKMCFVQAIRESAIYFDEESRKIKDKALVEKMDTLIKDYST